MITTRGFGGASLGLLRLPALNVGLRHGAQCGIEFLLFMAMSYAHTVLFSNILGNPFSLHIIIGIWWCEAYAVKQNHQNKNCSFTFTIKPEYIMTMTEMIWTLRTCGYWRLSNCILGNLPEFNLILLSWSKKALETPWKSIKLCKNTLEINVFFKS